MRIIPVIDLRHGRAVRGSAGGRASYRPVTSLLDTGSPQDLSDPVALLRAYRSILGVDRIYVADLDRIEGTGDNNAAIRRMLASCSDLRLMLDAGSSGVRDDAPGVPVGRIDRVIATETLAAPAALTPGDHDDAGNRSVLSLDLDRHGVVARSQSVRAAGEVELLREAVRRGFRRALLLVLYRIGSRAGLPRDRLRLLRDTAPEIEMLAGGGVASLEDLAFLREKQFDGALLATALHDGQITPKALHDAGFIGLS